MAERFVYETTLAEMNPAHFGPFWHTNRRNESPKQVVFEEVQSRYQVLTILISMARGSQNWKTSDRPFLAPIYRGVRNEENRG